MRLQESGLDFKYDGKPWSGFKVCLCIRVCVCVHEAFHVETPEGVPHQNW